ncbi:EamA family transporter [Olleya aquimaris]|uniref:Drug/metabolite transporter (DMT)-like permease n=1 Tax=Olleya aquimaris TaxID=639310 RepID=A0A327R759_9FLAO|nr:EamA family transporter [Olleya aquimaris]RAJ11948.1 drug/metabolite transporter (DMT)-like permease [Olleya aquimaris]
MDTTRKSILIILSFFSIYVIWGSTYMFNKIVVQEVQPLYLASVRFFCSAILILCIALFMKLSLKITLKQLKNSVIIGFLFLVYGNGVFVWALKYVDSGFAALIAATQPLFVILLMRVLNGFQIKTKALIGVVLGLIGMYLLVSQEGLLINQDSIIGIVLMFTCVLSWSYGSIFVSKADLPKSYLVTTGYQMIIASAMLIVLSFCFNETWSAPSTWSTNAQWSMVLLIIFGGVVAFTAFNYLLKEVSTEKVATSAYVNPVIALFLGWYVLEEQLSTQSIVAAFILLLGVYFINSKKKFVPLSRLRK